jgi:hypothetical protein
VGWDTATKESADMPEVWTKLGTPDIDEMCLVDTAVHNIAAIDGKCSNFTPSAVAQMFGVDTYHIPRLAFPDFVCEITSSLASRCYGFMAICESRDAEFAKFKHL